MVGRWYGADRLSRRARSDVIRVTEQGLLPISSTVRRFAACSMLALLLAPMVCFAQSGDGETHPVPTYEYCTSQLGEPTATQWGDAEFRARYEAEFYTCLLGAGATSIESEYLDRTRVSEKVQPLGPNPFGEHIGLYNGSLTFEQVDIDAPGTGLPLRVIRHFSIPNTSGAPNYFSDHFTANGMVDWRMEIPHIETLSAAGGLSGVGPWFFLDDAKRCNDLHAGPDISRNYPDSYLYWDAANWWHGFQLLIPGQGSQDLLNRAAGNPLAPPPMSVDGQTVTFPYTTKALWAIGCLDTTSNGAPGEGFFAVAPDGTQYWLDHLAAYEAHPLASTGSWHQLNRKWAMLLVSKVKDRFNNTLTYTYLPGTNRLDVITASDGRTLDFTWEAWPGYKDVYRIASATLLASDAPDRTWTYLYDDAGHPDSPYLKTVIRPDGATWEFNLSGLQIHSTSVEVSLYGGYCAIGNTKTYHGVDGSGTITHPSGLHGTFTDELVTRGRSHVPYECGQPVDMVNGPSTGHPRHPPLYTVRAITKKAFDGAGLGGTRTWKYTYSTPNACYTSHDHICTGSSPITVYTEVEDPAGHASRSTFHNRYDASESLLQSVAVHTGGAETPVLREENHGYAFAGAWPDLIGGSYQEWVNQDQVTTIFRENLRQIAQDGDTYTWEAPWFNEFAQVLVTRRDNDFDGQIQLAERVTYLNDTSLWVLGLPRHSINLVTGDVVSELVYDGSDDTLKERWSFDRQAMTYDFDSAGQLSWFEDALGHRTELSSYHRGIPQLITYADNTTKSLVVDDFGQIQSITDETNATTSYNYDDGGRLSHITYPTGDATAWFPVDIDYQLVTTNEYGANGTHWRAVRSEGANRQLTVYDATMRPVLSAEYDSASTEPGKRGHVTFRDFDFAGRMEFDSYPLDYATTLPASIDGIQTTYDALGRVTLSIADSDLYPSDLETDTEYLFGNRVRVTDPKNHVTTTTYQAFDTPAYNAATKVDFNGITTTTIDRDWYGKPESMTQSGTWDPPGSSLPEETVSVTHSFDYDQFQRLCKRTSPETGQTLYYYDAADRVRMSAEGQSGWVGQCTPESNVPAAAKVVRSYYSRNRLWEIDYAPSSNTPDTVLTYTLDGQVETATRGQSKWTMTYNHRGLMTSEELKDNSGWAGINSWSMAYQYDALGHRKIIQYPHQGQFDWIYLAPDALGRPTKVAPYSGYPIVTDVEYAPNGRPKHFVYGNGIVFDETQNIRGLPLTVTYHKPTSPGNFDDYATRTLTYDNNGNLTLVSDTASSSRPTGPGSRGTDSRSFDYDGLDRLTDMDSTWIGGDGGLHTDHYAYDPLGNRRYRRWYHEDSGGSGGRSYVWFRYDTTHNRMARTGGEIPDDDTDHTFTFDTRGNLFNIYRPVDPPNGYINFGFTFNLANELVRDQYNTIFAYDARGWRYFQRVEVGDTAPNRRIFVYDSSGLLRQRIENENSNVKTRYYYLGTRPVARADGWNQTISYIQSNYQNSPLFETDQNGNVTRSLAFYAYGQPSCISYLADQAPICDSTSFAGQSSAGSSLLGTTVGMLNVTSTGGDLIVPELEHAPGYAGSYPDRETGLLYMGARYLHGSRFISADPAPLNPLSPMGLNRYAYANNNPVRFTDPNGRAPQDSWYGLNDRGFRDWVHAEKQSQGRGGARNYTKSELKTLHEEWKALGKPRGKGGASGRGGSVKGQRGFIAPGLLFKANAILYLITHSENLNAGELEALEKLRQEAADAQKQKPREEPQVPNPDTPTPPPPVPKKPPKEENRLDRFHVRQF